MNLKLDLVRLANEDVIATSGLCAHYNADRNDGGVMAQYTDIVDHFYISDYTATAPSAAAGKAYKYSNNTLVESYSTFYDDNPALAFPGFTLTKNGWYHWNGTNYSYCEDQSDAAHPISVN